MDSKEISLLFFNDFITPIDPKINLTLLFFPYDDFFDHS